MLKRKLPASLLLSLLVLASFPTSVLADVWYAKINEVNYDDEGQPEILATILDEFGQAPEIAAFDFVEVAFGDARRFSGGDLVVETFSDTERGTDYLIILPGYQGFGRNNVRAAAQGAAWFGQTQVRADFDTMLVLMYGDGVAQLGEPGEVAALALEDDGIARVARPYMLSALDEAVRYYNELGPPGRRRVIILVGSGIDVRLGDMTEVPFSADATPTQYQQAWNRILREHQNVLHQYLEAIGTVGARIYTIGLNETRPDWLGVLETLARKTGGTHRRINNIGDFSPPVGNASSSVYGILGNELNRELILTPSFTLESTHVYDIWVDFRFPNPVNNRIIDTTTTEEHPYRIEVRQFGETNSIIFYLVAIGAILIVVFLLLVLLIYLVKKMHTQRKGIADRRELEETVAKGKTHCVTCYRLMQQDWDSCLFCESGMAPMEEKPQDMLDGEEAQVKLDELDGRTEPVQEIAAGTAGAAAAAAAYHNQKLCPTCGRVMAAEWTECLFCSAGMAVLPDAAPVQAAAPVTAPVAFGPAGAMAAGAAVQDEPAPAAAQAGQPTEIETVPLEPGGGSCPVCGREVPDDWTECLYCKAGV